MVAETSECFARRWIACLLCLAIATWPGSLVGCSSDDPSDQGKGGDDAGNFDSGIADGGLLDDGGGQGRLAPLGSIASRELDLAVPFHSQPVGPLASATLHRYRGHVTRLLAHRDALLGLGDGPGVLLTRDGLAWSYLPADRVSFARNLFVHDSAFLLSGGIGHVERSDDLMTWERTTLPETAAHSLSPIASVGGRLLGQESLTGHLWWKSESGMWLPMARPKSNIPLFGFAFNGEVFLGFGKGGVAVASFSLEGGNWVDASSTRSEDLLAATVRRGTFFLLASNNTVHELSESAGVFAWTKRLQDDEVGLSDLIAAEDALIAVGKNPSSNRGIVYRSADGLTWQRTDVAGAAAFVDVESWRDSLYAVDERSGIFVSRDGGHVWSRVHDRARNFSAVAFGADTFVAAGEGGLVVRSADGVTWAEASLPDSRDIRQVRFLNGSFYAVGPEGLLVSTNGAEWTALPSAQALRDIDDVAYDPKMMTFIAVQRGGDLHSSLDAKTWTRLPHSVSGLKKTAGVFGIVPWNGEVWMAHSSGHLAWPLGAAPNWTAKERTLRGGSAPRHWGAGMASGDMLFSVGGDEIRATYPTHPSRPENEKPYSEAQMSLRGATALTAEQGRLWVVIQGAGTAASVRPAPYFADATRSQLEIEDRPGDDKTLRFGAFPSKVQCAVAALGRLVIVGDDELLMSHPTPN